MLSLLEWGASAMELCQMKPIRRKERIENIYFFMCVTGFLFLMELLAVSCSLLDANCQLLVASC